MSSDLLIAIAIAFLVLFCGGMVMWFFERRAQPYFDRPAGEAMFPSFWWALNLVVNGGFEERMPRTVFGRAFAVLLVVLSLFIVSVFVAKITSVMTVEAISGSVNNVSDLYGQRVATINGSTAAGFLERREVDYSGFDSLEPMLAAFETAGRRGGLRCPDPQLLHRPSWPRLWHHGGLGLRENYGIVFPSGSSLAEDVNRALLGSGKRHI